MYNVEYSLVSDNWVKRFTQYEYKTIAPVIADMTMQLKCLLSTDDVALMFVGEFTYAIWTNDECAGFVTITNSAVFISEQRTRLNKVRSTVYL